MSKIKLSFSFLLAILFVGILSTAAFAAGTTTTYGGVKANLATTPGDLDNNYNTVTKSNVNQTGLNVTTNDGSSFNDVIKSDNMITKDGSVGTQRTHGSYMNNTNSCASCHQTHTGASAGLLFKNGEYATCSACHDGTLGFYNVMDTGSNSAGTFGGTHDGNMSAHLANGTVKLSAAPGGNNAEVAGKGGEWEEEFTCASCHAPHGSYSDRLLHEDPNGMGNTLITNGGKKLQNAPVVTTADLVSFKTLYSAGNVDITDANGKVTTANYVVYRFNIGDAGAPTNSDYTAKGLQTGDVVLQLMKWDPNATNASKQPEPKYVIDTDPWLHEYDFDSAHTKHYWTAFYDGSVYQNTDPSNKATYTTDSSYVGKYIDKVHTDSLKNGEKLGKGFLGVRKDETTYPGATTLTTAVNGVTMGNIARGYVVKLDISTPDPATNNVTVTTVSSLWASKLADGTNNPRYVANRGVAISTWCASCHTDYLASSGKDSGTFDHAYRHTTTSDSYTCVRCHYAHGTDVTIMRDARGLTYNNILNDTAHYFTGLTDPDSQARKDMVKDYLIDKNPDSALKRYTNMAVCWACHTSSHSGGTRNTDTYNYDPNAGVDTDRNGIEFDY